jgi:hypothetical protein
MVGRLAKPRASDRLEGRTTANTREGIPNCCMFGTISASPLNRKYFWPKLA